MKNIIKSLVIVVAVAAVASVATWAYFYDSSSSTGNTFSAGTLILKLSDNNEALTTGDITASFGGTNLKPGDALPQQTMTVRNDGTIDANHIDLTVTLPTGNGSALADAIIFPYDPDSQNGMRFGFTTSTGDSINMLTYLRGTYNDGDYDLQDGDTGASLYGALSGDTEISLQNIANLGKIRIVPDSNNQGMAAGTQAQLWIHPVIDTDLTTQGETVTATFTWDLHQDTSQY
ncbi:MAG: TasA family protein [Candidatus Moraniibacteriota bacterium]